MREIDLSDGICALLAIRLGSIIVRLRLPHAANGRFKAMISCDPVPGFGRSATRAADRRGAITRQFAPPFQERHLLRFRGTAPYSRAWNGREATAQHAGSLFVGISASLSFAVACACRSSLCPTPIVEPMNRRFGRIGG